MLTLGKQTCTALVPVNFHAGLTLGTIVAKKPKQEPIDIDSQWFFGRLEDARLSLRGMAKLMDMSPSSLSLRLAGKYKITMDEAALMARLLGATLEEIIQHSGTKIPKDSAKMVKLVGTIDAAGRVQLAKGAGSVARPGGLGPEVVALKGVERGWTFFYNTPQKLQPEAIGVLAVVENRWVGVLKRGSERGLWDVEGVFGGGVKGVRVTVATPVLLIQP